MNKFHETNHANQKIIEDVISQVGIQVSNVHISILIDICRRKSGEEVAKETRQYILEKIIQPEVNMAYKEILDRDADQDGLATYGNGIMTRKWSVQQVRDILNGSGERQAILKMHQEFEDYAKQPVNPEYLKKLVKNNVGKDISVKFMGAVGTTGYSQAAKSYFYSLFTCGVNVKFEPIQYHRSDVRNDSDKDIALKASSTKNIDYDYVILHSVPELWPKWVAIEKRRNPNVIIIGLTVFETNKVPHQWIESMRMVDYLITPCHWNQHVFERDVGKQVFTVHTPIDKHSEIPNPDFDMGVRDDEIVIFTINEWTSRKGMEDLVTSFLEEFDAKEDKVVLYIKTSTINQTVGENYIQEQRSKFENPPRIILVTKSLKDSDIASILTRGDVYVSLTKAEGTGLAACQALSFGKPVITTGYGGAIDYLKSGVFYISAYEVSPSMCNDLQPFHSNCIKESGICRAYPFYDPSMLWGCPDKEDAKRLMRFVVENLEDCRKHVTVGKKYIDEYFNYETIGLKMIDILNSIKRTQ
jgi:glycosyltransferase involved in cell wall biosynthesis